MLQNILVTMIFLLVSMTGCVQTQPFTGSSVKYLALSDAAALQRDTGWDFNRARQFQIPVVNEPSKLGSFEVGAISTGSIVKATDKVGEYYQIEDPMTGQTGWVSSGFVMNILSEPPAYLKTMSQVKQNVTQVVKPQRQIVPIPAPVVTQVERAPEIRTREPRLDRVPPETQRREVSVVPIETTPRRSNSRSRSGSSSSGREVIATPVGF